MSQGDEQAFGPPRYCAGEVKSGGGSRAARQNESGQLPKFRIELVDFAFEPVHLRLDDPQRLDIAIAAWRHAKIGAKIKEIVLNAKQHGVELGAICVGRGLDAGKSYGR